MIKSCTSKLDDSSGNMKKQSKNVVLTNKTTLKFTKGKEEAGGGGRGGGST